MNLLKINKAKSSTDRPHQDTSKMSTNDFAAQVNAQLKLLQSSQARELTRSYNYNKDQEREASTTSANS